VHMIRDVAASKGRNFVSQSLSSTTGLTIISRASCSGKTGKGLGNEEKSSC
jgi:hypothetical protein